MCFFLGGQNGTHLRPCSSPGGANAFSPGQATKACSSGKTDNDIRAPEGSGLHGDSRQNPLQMVARPPDALSTLKAVLLLIL